MEQSLPLKKMETLIGRSNDADVALGNRTVSRHHAKIVRTEGGHLLVDLHSWFGTFVNGKRISYHWLANGDRVEVGKDHAIALFFSEEDAAAPPGNRAAPLEALTDVLAEEHRNQADKRHLAELELMLAHETQKHLLRQHPPELEQLVFRASSNPARWVCGDFYNFIPSHDGCVTAVLGDVSGRGVAAALFSSMLQGCLEMQLRLGDSLEAASEKVNRFMCEKSHAGEFATMFLFSIDGGSGRYLSAGHKPAYLFRALTADVVPLESNSRLLGAFPESEFSTTGFELEKGDVLVVYSDGLIEAQNSEEEMFGEDRLIEVIRNEAGNGAAHLEYSLSEIDEGFVGDRPPEDDVTVMMVERKR